MPCLYCYFKAVGYKFQRYVYYGCHAVSMMAYKLKNIAILNAVKDIFRRSGPASKI